VQPVKITPRLDAKPWGGRRLAAWGVVLPPEELIGEALLTAPDAIVAAGPRQGISLGELAGENPASWVGENGLAATGGRPIFPLLVKLIDSQADLSIQVHPDDRAAAAAGIGTGKTEAYHILAAAPGSIIWLGMRPDIDPTEFAAACRHADGSAARFLRQVSPRPGMTVLIPAGTPHAVGSGVTLYEIQQPSNVTYRLDDWGRVDALGLPRPLHHDDGLAVLDPSSRPDPISPVRLARGHIARDLLVATTFFALERIAGSADGCANVAPAASPQVLTGIEGSWTVATADIALAIAVGETVILPVGVGVALTANAEGVLLRGWVPDLERDVIGPARAAGATMAQIRGLAGTPKRT
jgi:mannose-6-phosphate isomerase